MRLGAYVLCVMMMSSMLFAQKRYVVNAQGDMLPIPKGKSALSVVNQFRKTFPKQANGTSAACVPIQQFGNVPATHSSGNGTRFLHTGGDMIAIWFEAPTDGQIDSLFIEMNVDSLAQYPGHLIADIHHSNVYTGHGPGYGVVGSGVNPYYIAPPRVCWGYYLNTSDIYGGIAAFPEQATDPTWRSFYNANNRDYPGGSGLTDHLGEIADTTLISYPPCAEEIWGFGGVEIPIHPSTITSLDLNQLPPRPTVSKGYPFFVTFKNPATPIAGQGGSATNPGVVTVTGYTDGSENGTLNADPTFRRNFHNWKFYELPSFCGPGWLARGDVDLHIWYTMSATGDVPPSLNSVDALGYTTIANTPRLVQADISDCNFIGGGPVGVAHANLVYALNNGLPTRIGMSYLGGTSYSASIPGVACPGFTTYYVEATDVDSNVSRSATHGYRTLCLATDIGVADTGAVATSGPIYGDPLHVKLDTNTVNGAGPVVFYEPPATTLSGVALSPGSAPKDDGSAGPFAITPGFILAGDTMNYAWIGVNGAIALSKTANDTQYVNSNGFYTTFDLPVYQRRDTVLTSGVPKNMLMGLWADLIIGDDAAQYGNIYYKNDASHFIAEWDSVGRFDLNGTPQVDEEVFRIVLNKADGSIEYQYDDIGTSGIDTSAVVGIQTDSTNSKQFHGFLLVNEDQYPIETKPHSGQTVKIWPYYALPVLDAWNLLSIPGASLSNTDSSKAYLFRHASSPTAFQYTGSYVQVTNLKKGVGYWMKYSGTQTEGVPRKENDSVDVTLQAKWNIIGSISESIPTSSLTTTPPTGVLPPSPIYYNYKAGYHAVTTLDPGRGYWVKAANAPTAPAKLHINGAAAAPKAPPVATDDLTKLNTITLRGNGEQELYIGDESLVKAPGIYEMPPVPPAGGFDARFSSQKMVETYPTVMEKGKQYQYTIEIQSGSYPVTVQWNVAKQPDGRTLVITDGIDGKVLPNTVLNGTGSVRITNASVRTLVIKLVEGVVAVPKAFALGQNYPNPFNPTTRMSVDMPKTAVVEVSVYDILGQKVTTLMSGMQSAGYHTVEWNGTNQAGLTVPSGTYFVRMISENYTKVQKIMMMK